MVSPVATVSPQFGGLQIEYKGSPKAPKKAIFVKAAFNPKQPDGLVEIGQTKRRLTPIGLSPKIAQLSKLFRDSAGGIPTNFSDRFIRGLQQVAVTVSKSKGDKPLRGPVSQYTALYDNMVHQLTTLIKSGDVKPKSVYQLSGHKTKGQTIRLQKDPQLDPAVLARLNTLVAVIHKEFPKEKYRQAKWFDIKTLRGDFLIRLYTGPAYPQNDTGVMLFLGRHLHTYYDEAKIYYIKSDGKILPATHWRLFIPEEENWHHGIIRKESEYTFINDELKRILNYKKGGTIIGFATSGKEYAHSVDFKSLRALTTLKP